MKTLLTSFLILSLAGSAASADDSLAWRELPSLPDALGVAGPFAGVHNDALIVAGGANFPQPVWDNEKVWRDQIYVLTKSGDAFVWKEGGKLAQPIAYGAAVSTPEGVVCMGGNNSQATFAEVFLMRWDAAAGAITTKKYPSLPEPCAHGAATLVGDVIYFAGGQSGPSLESAMKNFWSLDLSKKEEPGEFVWRKLPEWPGASRALNLTVSQRNGSEDCVYVISGRRQQNADSTSVEFLKDVWEYRPAKREWRQRADVPRCVMAGTAIGYGKNEIIVLGGADGSLFFKSDELQDEHPGFLKQALSYDTVADVWTEAGPMPQNHVTTIAVDWNGEMIIPSGEIRPRVRSPKVWRVVREDLTVLTDAPRKQLERLLMREFYQHLDRRLAAYDLIKGRADCEQWQRERREFFIQQIGGLPERTPLHAEVVGKLQGEGYRVENVLFESRPGHHVTANLYLPTTTGPYPAVLVPCGHSHDGKAAGGYQLMSILLARNGMAALCYDPIGQGERYQSLDFEHDHETFGSVSYRLPTPHPRVRFLCTTEHTLMGVGSILLGTNTAQYRIWDGMRAIDYLQSRDDILADKIGCTGNSGGGTMTAYLMALDDRIIAAAPACYLTTFRRLIETKGAQDAEQNIFGQIAFGMDQPDYVMMRAPKPTLICGSTRDVTFDIGGTWDLFRQAKRFYARLGFPERVEMNEADVPHGMYLQHREAIARWMHRWLLGSDKVIQEVDPITLPDPISDTELRALSAGDWTAEQLYCTPEGQTLLMKGERSVFQINADIQRELQVERQREWKNLNADQRRALVRETIFGDGFGTLEHSRVEHSRVEPDTADRKTVNAKTIETIPRDGYRIEKVMLPGSEHQLDLPGLLFVPETVTGAPVLFLDGDSMKTEAAPGGRCEQLVKQGHIVLSAELSGIGETETGHDKRDYGRGRFGRDVQEIYLAYLIGRSYVGMRTDDLFRWADYLERRVGKKMQLIATGEACIPTLHAAALEPTRFESVELKQMIRSWADIVAATASVNQLVNAVHGALRHYDLPDLIELAGACRVKIEASVDASGGIIDEG